MPTYKQLQSLSKRTSLILFGCFAVLSLSNAQEPDLPSTASGDATDAQALTLFEDVETAESRSGPASRGARSREARVTTAEPEFTLVGVSRLGDKYSAILRDKDGESFIVKAGPATTTTIPEHSEYAIVDVTAAGVSIRYPRNNACVEFSDRGVTCSSAANIAQLVLANGEPLPGRSPATQDLLGQEAQEVANGEITEEQAERTNPFEALRNARQGDGDNAAAAATGTAGARFTPRRISPEDVPEGMRIIATPFGDRLVEQ